MALLAHDLQEDKAGELYLLHPLRVMLNPDLSTPTEQIVAVLHDVIEDSNITYKDLLLSFGREVADAVDALSRRNGETYDDFIRRCYRCPIARKVKLADIEDNLRSRIAIPEPAEKTAARRAKYRKAQKYLMGLGMDYD